MNPFIYIIKTTKYDCLNQFFIKTYTNGKKPFINHTHYSINQFDPNEHDLNVRSQNQKFDFSKSKICVFGEKIVIRFRFVCSES